MFLFDTKSGLTTRFNFFSSLHSIALLHMATLRKGLRLSLVCPLRLV
jgi:hypothetical protein